MVFHEIIMEAPEHLKTAQRKTVPSELKILERLLGQELRMPSISIFNLRPPRNHPTGELGEWRLALPRVPRSRLHPWFGRTDPLN